MVVDGGLFYDGIEGFDYEPGYDYRLRIGKYDPSSNTRRVIWRRSSVRREVDSRWC